MSRKSANYKFDDITIGLTKEFSIEITESMVDNFAEFSGDYNELHMDEDYASTTSFGKRICHGMLLTSFFFTIGRNVNSRKECTIFLSKYQLSISMFHRRSNSDKG